MTSGQLASVRVGDSATSWQSIGFTVEPPNVGRTTFRFDGNDRGICDVTVDGVDVLDGLALAPAPVGGDAPSATAHPNGVTAIDHIVVMTPDADRTTTAFEAAGLEARRVRRFETPEGPRRQTFFWLGDVICEVVGPDTSSEPGPARWWGLAFTVSDIDETAALLGDRVSAVRDAVQPGRRVCTLSSRAGISTPILFISPHEKAG